MSLTTLLSHHHAHCDEAFAALENWVGKADWARADAAFAELSAELEAHFTSEEDGLFPAFERSTGMSAGPTQVMRGEHRQMRQLLDDMRQALGGREAGGFAGAAETLLVLMQQHNMKEENILYPMCDTTIDATVAAELAASIGERLAAACRS